MTYYYYHYYHNHYYDYKMRDDWVLDMVSMVDMGHDHD